MDNIVYNALYNYYNALQYTGYMSTKHTYKLLVLVFYWQLINNDYRGIISEDCYRLIERALDCLYGSTCLIPYPDYLKMGKLNLGSISELAQRIEALEETEVLKITSDSSIIENIDSESDISIYSEED